MTLYAENCIAWDRVGGRPFDRELFDTFGKPCIEEQFREAAARFDDLRYDSPEVASIPIVLPKNFPLGTRFRDAEGAPLTALDGKCVVWSRPGGRWFNDVEFERRAYPVSEEEFRKIVAAINEEE